MSSARERKANTVNAWQILEQTANAYGQVEAFVSVAPDGSRQQLTFSELRAQVNALSAYFIRDLGLQPGDVVAVQLPNCLQYPVAVFAAWRAGLIVTCVNPAYTMAELGHQVMDCGAKVLICRAATARAVGQDAALDIDFMLAVRLGDSDDLAESGDGFGIPGLDAALSARADRPAVAARQWPAALYQYTGGTTGRSKGGIISHANLVALMDMAELQSRQYGHLRPGMTVLTPIPLYHIFALTQSMLLFVAQAGRNVLVASPRPLSNMRAAFEAYQYDWMFGVQTLYGGLLAEPWFEELSPSVGVSVTGGSALQLATGHAWRQLVGEIVEGYGLTETTGAVAVNPPNGLARLGTVGLPLPGLDIEIRRDDGSVCAPDEVGELFVRGPNVFEGYLNADDETAKALSGGWLRTGDVVVQDAEGFLSIVDRKKDLIIVSGFNVYPAEVEDVLGSHPAVLEVGVVGRPDGRTGEAVVAFVALKPPGATPEELIKHARRTLTAYKVPRQIFIRDELPKSPVGKVLRFALSKSLSEQASTV